MLLGLIAFYIRKRRQTGAAVAEKVIASGEPEIAKEPVGSVSTDVMAEAGNLPMNEVPVSQNEPVSTPVTENFQPLPSPIKIQRPAAEPVRNSILLFGDLQLFDSEGADITRYFTPLLKELFLVILI